MLLETTPRMERGYTPEDAEARRRLVKRIVASAAFARSNRLSEFLKYVYNLAEKGRFDEIHEQSIGSAVFERNRDYDPGVDSIVRSHATRLRHRLREYFEQEGVNEPLILTIPRGSYIPFFEPRERWSVAPESTIVVPEEILSFESIPSDPATEEPAADPSARKTIERLKIALAAAGVAIALLAVLLLVNARRPRAEDAALRNPLWKELLAGAAEKTIVVSADSGLVMFQHLTGRAVSLDSYISGDYLKQSSSETVPEDIVRKFGTRRYTPAVDLSVLDRLTQIFSERRDRLSFHYARDLRIEDLKQGNAILLGTSESNPWVQLFEPSMNFSFQDDLLHDKAQMVNRHPVAGEQAHYDSTPQDAQPTIYGLVAYRPNLQASGHVLILEGQTMAGTQAAVDFVFDNSYMLPFLNKIKKPDGSIPNFELLLRSSSFAGQSSRIDVVAYRVEAG